MLQEAEKGLEWVLRTTAVFVDFREAKFLETYGCQKDNACFQSWRKILTRLLPSLNLLWVCHHAILLSYRWHGAGLVSAYENHPASGRPYPRPCEIRGRGRELCLVLCLGPCPLAGPYLDSHRNVDNGRALDCVSDVRPCVHPCNHGDGGLLVFWVS